MKPVDALQRIPGMAEARVAEWLADGPASSSYRIERGGESFVLRLDKPAARELGLDRANERQVCEAVAQAGLGPPYRFFDPVEGISLRPFLPGRQLAESEMGQPETLRELAELLRCLHGLQTAGRVYAPGIAVRRYAAQLDTAEARELQREALSLLAILRQMPSEPALCHNDAVCTNILRKPEQARGPSLALIDWEYAAVGDPFFDLAVVLQHHGLVDNLTEHFLGAYLQREPTRPERARLSLHCRFYAVLLELWNLRTGQAGS